MATKRKGEAFTKRKCLRLIRYVRVSDTTGREESLISDDVQIDVTGRYAEREGHTIVETIVELDRTGRESSKRRIAEIINKVEAGEADGVVVWKVSRWGRNTLDSMLNLGELQSVGGVLLSATENIDEVDTPVGKFQLTLLLAVAQMYSDEIGKTWSNIHDYRRSLGKTPMGGARFGYAREDDEYRVDTVSGPWLRDAYRWYIAGEALNSIVGKMRDAGIMTTRGNKMTYNSLLAVLDSGFGAGLIVDRRGKEETFTKGAHEAVITEEQWAAYLRRRDEKVHPRTKHAPYRLAGLIRCTACGGRMLARWKYDAGKTKRRYFRCNNAKGGFHRNVDCQRPAQIDESRLNALVKDWLQSHAEGDEALAAAAARAQRVEKATADRGAIEKKIDREKRRLSILADKVLDGVISDEAAKMKEAEILNEINLLKESLDRLGVDVAVNAIPTMSAFGAVATGWDFLDPALLNEGLKKVIRCIEVTKHEERYGPARVRIVGQWEPEKHLQAV